MSKAYDRVNIHMLRDALNRLKLPIPFQIFIENLFTNRWNSVFTPFGLTDKYNTLVGIDQGEVICPLLWCIYYDPLLSFIQNSDLGFKMQVTWNKNITAPSGPNNIVTKSVSIPNTAFINDTTWISDSQDKMNRILNIADSFYRL